ncbi:MAG: tetratricopeptide repeat protein [Pseudomonadota bacterium]
MISAEATSQQSSRMPDCRGLDVTAGSALAVSAFDDAIRAFLRHGRDTPDHLKVAFGHDPDLTIAHAAKGLWSVLMGRREVLPVAKQALQDAKSSLSHRGGTAREHAFVAALERAVVDDFNGAVVVLETSLAEQPHDALAMKLGHQMRFMTGDGPGMQQSTARHLAHWTKDMPDYGYLLGCHAFGLEETGSLEEAERAGRAAVEIEPEDAWGFHAVAHVFEVSDRPRDGVSWLVHHTPALKRSNNFAYHVFWHRALFHLTMGEIGTVLSLYDQSIRADKTDDFRDVANAVSLLWRLQAMGVDVGGRWGELAELAERHIGDHAYGFADGHYLLALVGAGRDGAAARFVQSAAAANTVAPDGAIGHQPWVWRSIGCNLAEAILAFGRGDDDGVISALIGVRDRVHLLGGSNVQRDVFELVILEAAVRSGNQSLASSLMAERCRKRGDDGFTYRWGSPDDLATEPLLMAGAGI